MDTKDIPFFISARPETFKWPVKVPVPADGRYDLIEFTAVFKYLDDAGEKALLEADQNDRERLQEVLLAVEGLTYADGTAVPSTPDLVASVIALDRVAPVTLGTFLGARRGLASEKNS